MNWRKVVLFGAALMTAACLGTARLERPLPAAVGTTQSVKTIEITDESGAVVLHGQFAEPEDVDGAAGDRDLSARAEAVE